MSHNFILYTGKARNALPPCRNTWRHDRHNDHTAIQLAPARYTARTTAATRVADVCTAGIGALVWCLSLGIFAFAFWAYLY